MDILDRRLLYTSQVFSGAVLAISVVGLFSEGIHVLWLLLSVLGSITVIMFYIILVLSVESGGVH